MKKQKLTILFFFLSFFLLIPFSFTIAEELTITTYYPSPHGVYMNLITLNDTYLALNTGAVGIGTNAPQATLHIKDDTGTLLLLERNGIGDLWALGVDAARFSLMNRTTGGLPIVVGNNGNIGIGTGSVPTYQLQLSADSAAKLSTTTWTVTSDSRVKKDIRPYTNGLNTIRGINPVWFKHNGKGGFPVDTKDNVGVIAQEIVKVAPYTIDTYKAKLNPEDTEETELLNFNPHALLFDLINAVKELDTTVTQLKQENQELKQTNKDLKAEIDAIKIRLDSLAEKKK